MQPVDERTRQYVRKSAAAVIAPFIGATITTITLQRGERGDPDEIIFTFADRFERLSIYDAGQDCCEERYFTVDEREMEYLFGCQLQRIDVRYVAEVWEPSPSEILNDNGLHEIAFLWVHGSWLTWVATIHNRSNGYYTGFTLAAKVLPPEPAE